MENINGRCRGLTQKKTQCQNRTKNSHCHLHQDQLQAALALEDATSGDSSHTVWGLVLKHLDTPESIFAARLVNHDFKDLLSEARLRIKSHFRWPRRLLDICPQIRGLACKVRGPDENILDDFQDPFYPKIKELSIDATYANKQNLGQILERFPNVERLHIKDGELDVSALQVNKLVSLTLTDIRVNSATLDFSNCLDLRQLRLQVHSRHGRVDIVLNEGLLDLALENNSYHDNVIGLTFDHLRTLNISTYIRDPHGLEIHGKSVDYLVISDFDNLNCHMQHLEAVVRSEPIIEIDHIKGLVTNKYHPLMERPELEFVQRCDNSSPRLNGQRLKLMKTSAIKLEEVEAETIFMHSYQAEMNLKNVAVDDLVMNMGSFVNMLFVTEENLRRFTPPVYPGEGVNLHLTADYNSTLFTYHPLNLVIPQIITDVHIHLNMMLRTILNMMGKYPHKRFHFYGTQHLGTPKETNAIYHVIDDIKLRTQARFLQRYKRHIHMIPGYPRMS